MTGKVLYVETGTEDERRAVEFMASSGLEVEVLSLSRQEAQGKRDYYRSFPILFAPEGIIRGMEYIEWYANCFGVGGSQHRT